MLDEHKIDAVELDLKDEGQQADHCPGHAVVLSGLSHSSYIEMTAMSR